MWSCRSQKTLMPSDKSLQREWMMVSFKDYPKEKLVKYEAKISLIPNAESPDQFSAKMGCNSMFFTAKTTANNQVKFSEVGSTMIYCQDMMDVESDFATVLPKMTKYKIDGHYLTLMDTNGNTMKFIAADWD